MYKVYNSGDCIRDAISHQHSADLYSDWSRHDRDIRKDFLLANEAQVIAAYHYRCARTLLSLSCD